MKRNPILQKRMGFLIFQKAFVIAEGVLFIPDFIMTVVTATFLLMATKTTMGREMQAKVVIYKKTGAAVKAAAAVPLTKKAAFSVINCCMQSWHLL